MKYLEIKGYQETVRTSRIAMGSAMSMMRLSSGEIYRLFDEYLDRGGNCLDTARAYGEGRCEEMVADYIRHSGKRGQILISTKGCHPIGGDNGPSRLSLEDLETDINSSLKTFGTDCIDFYWIHKDDETLPVEPIVDSINQIIREGKARVVGCSNWHIERIQAANAYARKTGQCGFLASQIQWSFTETKEEYFKEHGAVVMDQRSYEWYLQEAMPVFAFSSQAQGFCARVQAEGLENLPAPLRLHYETPENMIRYERALNYAQSHEVPIAAPVLAHIVNNKLPGVAIIGAMDPEMLSQSLTGGETDLTPEEVDAMFEV